MHCTRCHDTIDAIRLEVLPDTTLCKRCAHRQEPTVTPVPLAPALDPQPYIDAEIPSRGLGKKSMYLSRRQRKHIQNLQLVNIPDPPPKPTKKKLDRYTEHTIPITFYSRTSISTYYYKDTTISQRFAVPPAVLTKVLTRPTYRLYVQSDILYVDYKDGTPPQRLGEHQR